VANVASSVESGCSGNRSSAWWMLLAEVRIRAGRPKAWPPQNPTISYWTSPPNGVAPCQQMSSIVSKTGTPGTNQFVRSTWMWNHKLAAKYGVKSIPCFVLVSNGQEIDRVSGLTTEQQLKEPC